MSDNGTKLKGAAAVAHEAAEARRAVAAERLEDVRALARVLARLAGRTMNTAEPDALRLLAGRDDALRVLRQAGRDIEAIAGNLDTERPMLRQATLSGSPWEDDPLHDPAYIEVACRLGPSHPEAQRTLQRIVAERASAKAEARAAGTGRMSVREGIAAMRERDRAEAEERRQRMLAQGYREAPGIGWLRDRPQATTNEDEGDTHV